VRKSIHSFLSKGVSVRSQYWRGCSPADGCGVTEKELGYLGSSCENNKMGGKESGDGEKKEEARTTSES